MKFNEFIGIDISKKTLDYVIYNKTDTKLSEHKVFSNDKLGFKKSITWMKKQNLELTKVLFCMEHTGVYGLELQSFLSKEELNYCVISGLELKKSLGIVRGKTDKSDAFQIARYAYLFKDEIKLSKLSPKNIFLIKNLLNEMNLLFRAREGRKLKIEYNRDGVRYKTVVKLRNYKFD